MDPLLRSARYLRMRRRRDDRLDLLDVVVTPMRVWPSDLDELGHMNNGVYLSTLDMARLDLFQRTGLWSVVRREAWYPVVTMQTITYRRSLQPWARFDVQSRIVGFDERSTYLEHRFVTRGEIAARAVVVGRLLKRSGGSVSTAELGRVLARPLLDHQADPALLAWHAAFTLPSTRAAAPSDWTIR